MNNNKLNVKEVFTYDKKLYLKQKKKKKIQLFVYLIIWIVSLLYFLSTIHNKNTLIVSKYLLIMTLILIFILPLILLYSLLNFSLWNDGSLYDKFYLITSDNQLIALEFNHDYVITNMYALSKIKKQILNKDVDFNNLNSCIKIINVYKIKELYDRYEIKCDYEDKKEDEKYLNENITIYKYFDNEKIYTYLNKIKSSKKIVIGGKKNHWFLTYIVNSNMDEAYFISMTFFILKIIADLFKHKIFLGYIISFGILLIIYLINYLLLKVAYKYEMNEYVKDKLDKKLYQNKIISIVSFILIFLFLIIYEIKIY